VSGLRRFGPTQQKLLRELLQAPQGATVETLCVALRITHNAVRQHLTALLAAGTDFEKIASVSSLSLASA